MVVALLQLGSGNEPPQALEIAGHTATVEPVDDHLHHLPLLLEFLDLVPALAQFEGPAADGDHAIGVLFAGDQHLDLQAFGEPLTQVGDHPQAGLAFGHESRRFAADVHIDAITFKPDHGALHHISRGAHGSVLIQGGQEGFFVEVEVVNAAGFVVVLAAGCLVRGSHQIRHGHPLHGTHVEAIVIGVGHSRSGWTR